MRNTVKYLTKRLLAFFLLVTSTFSYAEIESDFTYESFFDQAIAEIESGNPFKFEFEYDYVGRSKIKKKEFKGQHVTFSEGDVSLDAVFWYNPEHQEGLTAGFGYTHNNIDWHRNPYFDRNNFNAYVFRIGAFTKRATDWFWIAFGQMNLDADHTNWNQYANYDLLLWGRYNFIPDVGLHVGFVAMTGMKIDRIWPVLGFDWKIDKHWMLKMVFPLDMALIYEFNKCWCAEVAFRAFMSRYRLGKHELLSKGLVQYRNYGAEFGVTYHHNNSIKANVHVGYAAGDELKISNRHKTITRIIDFGGAPYAGAAFEFEF